MTECCRFGRFSVHRRVKEEINGFTVHENIIKRDNQDYLYIHDLTDCKDVANVLSVYDYNNEKLKKENEQLKKDNKILLKHCEKHGIIVPMNYERYKEYVNDD